MYLIGSGLISSDADALAAGPPGSGGHFQHPGPRLAEAAAACIRQPEAAQSKRGKKDQEPKD